MDIARPELKTQRQRRRIIIGAIAALATAAAAYGVSRLEPAAPQVERQSIWIDTVKRGELLREVRGPGQLVPKETRWIAADAAASVERIVVRPGARVEPDTLIIELGNPEIDDQMLSARAALEAAKADLDARRRSASDRLRL